MARRTAERTAAQAERQAARAARTPAARTPAARAAAEAEATAARRGAFEAARDARLGMEPTPRGLLRPSVPTPAAEAAPEAVQAVTRAPGLFGRAGAALSRAAASPAGRVAGKVIGGLASLPVQVVASLLEAQSPAGAPTEPGSRQEHLPTPEESAALRMRAGQEKARRAEAAELGTGAHRAATAAGDFLNEHVMRFIFEGVGVDGEKVAKDPKVVAAIKEGAKEAVQEQMNRTRYATP